MGTSKAHGIRITYEAADEKLVISLRYQQNHQYNQVNINVLKNFKGYNSHWVVNKTSRTLIQTSCPLDRYGVRKRPTQLTIACHRHPPLAIIREQNQQILIQIISWNPYTSDLYKIGCKNSAYQTRSFLKVTQPIQAFNQLKIPTKSTSWPVSRLL